MSQFCTGTNGSPQGATLTAASRVSHVVERALWKMIVLPQTYTLVTHKGHVRKFADTSLEKHTRWKDGGLGTTAGLGSEDAVVVLPVGG